MQSMLKFNSIYSISIKIQKSSLNKIDMGICSKKMFCKSSKSSIENISCDLETVGIWSAGKWVSTRPAEGLKQGQFVKMRVDLLKDQVSWFKKSK